MAIAYKSELANLPILLHMMPKPVVQTEPTEMLGCKHTQNPGSDGFETQNSIHMSIAMSNDRTFALQMVVWYKAKTISCQQRSV